MTPTEGMNMSCECEKCGEQGFECECINELALEVKKIYRIWEYLRRNEIGKKEYVDNFLDSLGENESVTK